MTSDSVSSGCLPDLAGAAAVVDGQARPSRAGLHGVVELVEVGAVERGGHDVPGDAAVGDRAVLRDRRRVAWVSGSVALITWSSLPTFVIVVLTAEDWSVTLPFVGVEHDLAAVAAGGREVLLEQVQPARRLAARHRVVVDEAAADLAVRQGQSQQQEHPHPEHPPAVTGREPAETFEQCVHGFSPRTVDSGTARPPSLVGVGSAVVPRLRGVNALVGFACPGHFRSVWTGPPGEGPDRGHTLGSNHPLGPVRTGRPRVASRGPRAGRAARSCGGQHAPEVAR